LQLKIKGKISGFEQRYQDPWFVGRSEPHPKNDERAADGILKSFNQDFGACITGHLR
jgi:hypothetical protein